MKELTVQEIRAEEKREVGRPKLQDKLVHKKFGLYEDEWEYLRQWQSESGTEGENFGPAVRRLIERCRDLAPGGPDVKRKRGERGWFLPEEDSISRNAETRRRRRQQREREKQAQQEGEGVTG